MLTLFPFLRLTFSLRLNTTVTSLALSSNRLRQGAGRALAETLRLNTTLTLLQLSNNGLGEGGGRALAEALRLNTTVTSLDLWNSLDLWRNDLREEVQSALGRGDRGGSLKLWI
jgi:Ran GTPase-activating protein (RanGAP) involved in mRNA processing and transport